MAEVPLRGNVTAGVVRVGDTVRRPAGPQTPVVHALLAHLVAAGLPGVPRPLGTDARGRQVLSFVPGEPVFPDRPDLYGTDAGLAGIARYVRGVHDALAGFRAPVGTPWAVVAPDLGDGPVQVVHHDLAPWNVLRSDPRDPWGLVDWDGAGPGTREWDLALAAVGSATVPQYVSFRVSTWLSGSCRAASGVPRLTPGRGRDTDSQRVLADRRTDYSTRTCVRYR